MLTLWVLTDGKRGHENQSLGLADALARLAPVQTHLIPVKTGPGWMLDWLLGRFPSSASHPRPDLILAAGHAVHGPLLAARRAFGGKAVVLMKPSLPPCWFDRVIAPEHDGLRPGSNRLLTQGPLNRIHPGKATPRSASLFLIGGPSPHFRWDNESVIRQIGEIARHDPERQWSLTTSRRTPAEFLAGLQKSAPTNLTVVPHDQTGPDWLPGQLTRAQLAWVTPDSVSMVYEALTAGAGVGLLDLPARHTRVADSILKLQQQNRVSGFSGWQQNPLMPRPVPRFNEADRIAGELLQWLNAN